MSYQESSCPACSAPILVTQNQPQITCPYCRTVLTTRGDGADITLELAEKVSTTLAQSGAGTVEELRRIERRQELRDLENRDAWIAAELREIRRAPKTAETTRQETQLSAQRSELRRRINYLSRRVQLTPQQWQQYEQQLEQLRHQLTAVRAQMTHIQQTPGIKHRYKLLGELHAQELATERKIQILEEAGRLANDEETKPAYQSLWPFIVIFVVFILLAALCGQMDAAAAYLP